MSRPLLALLLLAALAPGCNRDKAETPERVVGIEDELQDDFAFLFSDADANAREARALGVDRIRVTALWDEIAPAANSRRRPRFDAADPNAYPAGSWKTLDNAIPAITRNGLRAMVDLAFWAPRWAVQRDTGGRNKYRWKPDPVEFGKFAEAVARRYPQVRLWTTWNEPNHVAFLLPQWERRGRGWFPVAAHWYRRMHEEAYAAIKRVSKRNRVLIGGLTSIGSAGRGNYKPIRPLRFVREMACVDRKLRPLRAPECRGFRPLQADGFAHHPYMHKQPPNEPLPDPDSVGMADLDRLSSLLERLWRRGRIERRLPLYITEFGYETNPPDPKRGISPLAQAIYLNQAAAIAYSRTDVRMFAQFGLRDVPDDPLYQTALKYPDGAPKPAYSAWPLPFWIGGRDSVGRVRTGSGRREVQLERLEGRRWQAVGKTFRTGLDGIVRRRTPGPGLYRLRSGQRVSLPARAR